MPKVDVASLNQAEAEVNAAEQAYRQKLANLVALARAVLAAKPQDAGVGTNDPNDPNKGHG
jgi:hypothetical protein